jgi:putative transposase
LTRTLGCSIAVACRALDKSRSWYYYRCRGHNRSARRPEVEMAIRQLLGSSPASYGYRRIHALLGRRGLVCNPKTVWRIMSRRGWLSTSRHRVTRSGRRHEGRVQVPESNHRWASDITGIRAWDGQKGRLAVMIDCADRMVLAWRFAKRITAEDLAEMLREAVFRRFGEERVRAQGIEFLSDNGPEYTSHRFRPLVRALGLVPCHTPRRSPESNGLAEAFFGSLKRDYVYQACLKTLEVIEQQLPGWIEHYNHQAPHSALGMQAPAEFYADWLVKNRKQPVQF